MNFCKLWKHWWDQHSGLLLRATLQKASQRLTAICWRELSEARGACLPACLRGIQTPKETELTLQDSGWKDLDLDKRKLLNAKARLITFVGAECKEHILPSREVGHQSQASLAQTQTHGHTLTLHSGWRLTSFYLSCHTICLLKSALKGLSDA